MNEHTLYHIYHLIDPLKRETFYVGMTDNLIERYIAHLKMRDENLAKNDRIASLLDKGVLPLMFSRFQIRGRSKAEYAEAVEIEISRAYGYPLTNKELNLYPGDVVAKDALEIVKEHIAIIQEYATKLGKDVTWVFDVAETYQTREERDAQAIHEFERMGWTVQAYDGDIEYPYQYGYMLVKGDKRKLIQTELPLTHKPLNAPIPTAKKLSLIQKVRKIIATFGLELYLICTPDKS
jgi:hypothetical protein